MTDSGHNGFKKLMLTTPAGESFVIHRRPNQAQDNFVSTLATSRSKIKRSHGVATTIQFSGDTATIHVTKAATNVPKKTEPKAEAKEMGQKPGEILGKLLETPDGGTFAVKRAKEQTPEQFSKAIQNARGRAKAIHGITSVVEMVGDYANIRVISGLNKPAKAVAKEQDKRELRDVVRSMAPVEPAPLPAPLPEPAKEEPFPSGNEEARAFYKEVYIESIRCAPAAPPEFHGKAAKEAALEFARRFGGIGNG